MDRHRCEQHSWAVQIVDSLFIHIRPHLSFMGLYRFMTQQLSDLHSTHQRWRYEHQDAMTSSTSSRQKTAVLPSTETVVGLRATV